MIFRFASFSRSVIRTSEWQMAMLVSLYAWLNIVHSYAAHAIFYGYFFFVCDPHKNQQNQIQFRIRCGNSNGVRTQPRAFFICEFSKRNSVKFVRNTQIPRITHVLHCLIQWQANSIYKLSQSDRNNDHYSCGVISNWYAQIQVRRCLVSDNEFDKTVKFGNRKC